MDEKPRAFYKFGTYLWRWCLFGFIGASLMPVYGDAARDAFWTAKLMQGLDGLLFGVVCAVVFTPIQNKTNPRRHRGMSWANIIGVWMAAKFAFAGLAQLFAA